MGTLLVLVHNVQEVSRGVDEEATHGSVSPKAVV